MSILSDSSINFSGNVGVTVPPSHFPAENYLINEHRYNAEGNWAFCCFDDPEIYGARMGFTRGSFDFSDFGSSTFGADSYLQLHLELLTRDGAILWVATGKYQAEQISLDPARMSIGLADGQGDLFRVSGWPAMQWDFVSDDRELQASLNFDLEDVTILPDGVLPHNVFSMWLATGKVSGNVRHRDRTQSVRGMVFYDHPRIRVQRSTVALRKWYLYTPIAFSDGSRLASYYAEDVNGLPIQDYCFGVFIDPQGNAQWLGHTKLLDIRFDHDDLPGSWRLRWDTSRGTVDLAADTRTQPILRLWGGPGTPKSRREFTYIPLVLDGRLTAPFAGSTGTGLAEFWRHT